MRKRGARRSGHSSNSENLALSLPVQRPPAAWGTMSWWSAGADGLTWGCASGWKLSALASGQ